MILFRYDNFSLQLKTAHQRNRHRRKSGQVYNSKSLTTKAKGRQQKAKQNPPMKSPSCLKRSPGTRSLL